jgi:hypothetical protein
VKVGDTVSVPLNVGCGFCTNCERGLARFCLIVGPGSPAAPGTKHERLPATINELIDSLRTIGMPGVWVPEDPEAPDENVQVGERRLETSSRRTGSSAGRRLAFFSLGLASDVVRLRRGAPCPRPA